jgi:hypothetical protein
MLMAILEMRRSARPLTESTSARAAPAERASAAFVVWLSMSGLTTARITLLGDEPSPRQLSDLRWVRYNYNFQRSN